MHVIHGYTMQSTVAIYFVVFSHSATGGDPHFSIVLPDSTRLCYSIQGKVNTAFNLISNSKFIINALFVPDSKREEVTWMGSIGVVFTKALRYGGSKITHFKFDAVTQAIHVGDKITLSAKTIKEIASKNGSISIIELTNHATPPRHPAVVFHLAELGLHFTVKFRDDHLDMFWFSPVTGSSSHGLIGEPLLM